MSQRVVHFLEPVEIQIEEANVSVLAARGRQRGVEAVAQQRPVGQAGQFIELGHALELCQQLHAFDGGGHLCGHEVQQRHVAVGVAGLARHALEHQCTGRAVLGLQRHSQPAAGIGCGGDAQLRLPGTHHFAAQRMRRSRPMFVETVGKAEHTVAINGGDEEVVGRHQAVDDQPDVRAQRRQVARCVRRFGQRIQRGLGGLCSLALRDVARNRNAQPVGFPPAGRPQDMHAPAVLAHIAVLEVQLVFARHDFGGRLQRACAIFRRHQFDHRAADHFVLRVAEYALAGRADEHEAAVFIDHAYGVGQQVQEGPFGEYRR